MDILAPERSQNIAANLPGHFDRIDVTYKTVSNTPIEAAILIPKGLAAKTGPETAPVLVHFHGGGLATGTNPDPSFLANWVCELASSTPAIMISPAYRMIPESHATDTLDDISDFWTWLHEPGTLTSAIQSRFPSLTPDLDHVATIGDSAGGYLALQSTLSLDPARTKIRVAMAQYPALFSDLPAWNARPEEPDPALDKVVADYVQALEPGKIRVSTPWPGLQEVVFAMLRNGLMREYGLGKHERLTAEYAIAKAKGFGRVPPIWIIQGTEDHLVATAATDQLVSRLRAELSDLKLKYTVQPGDHGFDCFSKLEDDWVAEGVDWIKGFWL